MQKLSLIKDRKAISTYLAAILLIMLVIAAGVFFYANSRGWLNPDQGNQKAIMLQSVTMRGDNLWIYVKNTGVGSIKLDPDGDSHVYMNEERKNYTILEKDLKTELPVGKTCTIQIENRHLDPEMSGKTCKFKVISADGVFAEGSYILTYSIIITPTKTTMTLSDTTITNIESVTATASVNPPTATGQMLFQVSTDGVTWNSVGASKILIGGKATSDQYKSSVGLYYLKAIYQSDSVYSGSTSDISQLIVTGLGTTLSTTTTELSASTITLSESVTATASVNPPTATGQVLFQVSTDGVTWNSVGASKTLIGGTATSDQYTPVVVGLYYFRAIYFGDSTNGLSKSGDAEAILTVNPTDGGGTASKLVFNNGASQTLRIGVVSGPITVQRQDATNIPSNLGGATTVNLASSSPGGAFYSNVSGATAITSIVIDSGVNESVSFYYKDSTVGSFTITGTSANLIPATTTFTTSPIIATKLVFTAGADQSLVINEVSSKITLQRQDADGNPAGNAQITVNLATTSLGSDGGKFTSDANGNSIITSVTIAADTSSTDFYYYDKQTGTPTITASSGNLTSATTVFTIIDFELSYRDGDNQKLLVNQVSDQMRIRRTDTIGDTITVRLTTSTTSTGKFFLDSNGTTQITSVKINSGSSSSSYFYYKDTAVGSPVLTASSSGYTSAKTTFSIRLPKLAFTVGGGQTFTVDAVSSQITVQRQTATSGPYFPDVAITLELTSSSGSGVFYSDAAGTNVITSVTIASGVSSTSFYYMDTEVGSPVLTATSAGYTSATTTFNISSGNPNIPKLNFSFNSQSDWDAGWEQGTQPPWRYAEAQEIGETGTATCDSLVEDDGPFTSDPIDASRSSIIRITFQYKVHQTETNDLWASYSGISYPNISAGSPDFHSLGSLGSPSQGRDVWVSVTYILTRATNPDAFTTTFRFRFESDLFGFGTSYEQAWIDNVLITMDA